MKSIEPYIIINPPRESAWCVFASNNVKYVAFSEVMSYLSYKDGKYHSDRYDIEERQKGSLQLWKKGKRPKPEITKTKFEPIEVRQVKIC